MNIQRHKLLAAICIISVTLLCVALAYGVYYMSDQSRQSSNSPRHQELTVMIGLLDNVDTLKVLTHEIHNDLVRRDADIAGTLTLFGNALTAIIVINILTLFLLYRDSVSSKPSDSQGPNRNERDDRSQ
jgi:hypothetical protein